MQKVEAFTKGPWTVGYRALDVTALDGRMKVCDIRGWGYLTGRGGGLALQDSEAEAIQLANAHLIAAAPELYGALDKLVEVCIEQGFAVGPHGRVAIGMDALRKARGETQ